MNYNIYILFLLFIFSCTKELSVTDFSEDFSNYDRELRVEAVMLPHENSAIIRIDQSILITDETLFDCKDDNDNWIGSACVCGDDYGFNTPESNCPSTNQECELIGGIWTQTLYRDFIYVCILSDLTKDECENNQNFDFQWKIIDDLGEDGQPNDPTDEDKDGDVDEYSEGENNGVPDCGEPHVDELEEITELSGDIHVKDCETVKITFNYDTNFDCLFNWSDNAGTMYSANGIIGFADGSGCETSDLTLVTQNDLDALSYDYGGWVPSTECENYVGSDGLGFFEHRNNSVEYDLFIECNNQVITSSEKQKIPYPVIFVDQSSLNGDNLSSCSYYNTEDEINECLQNNSNSFQLEGVQTYQRNEGNNILNYVATSVWYHATQYNNPFYSPLINDSCESNSENEQFWFYYHGHPAVAYPSSESTNHFPAYPAQPTIFSNEEVIVSNSTFDIGCYRYDISTFSDGYQKYYLSQLNLKDPERSNLRSNGNVVIGCFGAMNTNGIDFIIE